MIKIREHIKYAALYILKEQSCGEWDDKTLIKDADILTKILMDLGVESDTQHGFHAATFKFVEKQSCGEWTAEEVAKDAQMISDFMWATCSEIHMSVLGIIQSNNVVG